MGILDRYIIKILLRALMLIFLIFLGLFLLIDLLNELKIAGTGDYDFLHAFLYSVFRLPFEFYRFLPLLLLLGVLSGLSTLLNTKELIAMRAIGFSMARIFAVVLSSALFLIILITLIGELWVPQLTQKSLLQKEISLNKGQAVAVGTGIWMRVGDNFIHIEKIINRNWLSHVTRYAFDANNELQAANYANEWIYEKPNWIMKKGVKTIFSKSQARHERFTQENAELQFNRNILNVGLIDAGEMSLKHLYQFSAYLKQNGIRALEYQFVFWSKIFQPISSLVMVFLAIPFVLYAFRETSTGLRLLLGILVGFSFYILNAILGQLSVVYQLPPWAAALFVPILFALLGWRLMIQMMKL